MFMFMVFDATFHNISVISWRSVLLMEETGVPGATKTNSHKTEEVIFSFSMHDTRHALFFHTKSQNTFEIQL
jgi:hypothetical protein